MKPPEHPFLERITLRHFGTQILEQLNLERGLGYTIKGLLFRPKKVVNEYLFENRKRMTKPLTFLLLVIGATVFLSFRYLGLETEMTLDQEQEIWIQQLPESFQSAIKNLLTFAQQYFNLAMMSAIPVTALVTYFFFRECRLFYAEHLVINTYIYSIQSFLTLLFLPFMVKVPFLAGLAGILTLAYMAFAIIEIFEQSWWEGILKAIAVYVSSQVIYFSIVLMVLLVIVMIS